jgi:type I restriction enzyme S subunit
VLRAGDTVFSTVRPYLEKIAFIDRTLENEFASTGFAVLRPGPRLDPKFLYYFAISREMLAQVLPLQKGVSYPAVLDREVRAAVAPVPPVDEQHRIVAVLDDLLSRVDGADSSVTRAAENAVTLVRATLFAGLRGELVEEDLSEGTGADAVGGVPAFAAQPGERVWSVPSTWVWARLGDLFKINVGATPSRAVPEFWSGELPWVSSGEVAFNRIADTTQHIARSAAGNPATRIHPPGTVMLAMIGEGKTRGQAAILEVEAAHNQNCASIRVGETRVLPEYIYGYLQERYLETRRGGSGGQQPALNKGAIQRFPVPIPPVGTQRRLVHAWQQMQDTTDRLSLDLEVARQRSAALRASLLSAAFAGRLTDSLPRVALERNGASA